MGCIPQKQLPPRQPNVRPLPVQPLMIMLPSGPVKGTVQSPEVIKKISETRKLYSKCYVRLQFLDDTGHPLRGTGFIIHKTRTELLVLTCLHNFIKQKDEDKFVITGSIHYDWPTVYIEGRDDHVNTVEPIFHPDRLDVALLIVKYAYQANLPQICIESVNPDKDKQIYVVISGYGSGIGESSLLEHSQPSHTIDVIEAHEPQIKRSIPTLQYSCKTQNGFSGSPVLLLIGQSKTPVIAGVHTTRDEVAGRSRGVAITSSLKQWIHAQIQKSNQRQREDRRFEQVKEQFLHKTVVDLAAYQRGGGVIKDIKSAIMQVWPGKDYPVQTLKCFTGIAVDSDLLKHLVKFDSIRRLDMNSCSIGNGGFIHILKKLPKLEVLTLRKNKISVEVIDDLEAKLDQERLQKSPLMLRELYLDPIYSGSHAPQLMDVLDYLSNLERLQIGKTSQSRPRLHTCKCLLRLANDLQSSSQEYAEAKRARREVEAADLEKKVYMFHIKELNHRYERAKIRVVDSRPLHNDQREKKINQNVPSRIRWLIESMVSRIGGDPKRDNWVHCCEPNCIS